VGAVCLNWARTDLCGGREVTRVPTAIIDRRLMRGSIGYLPPVRARRDKNIASGVASAAPPLADYPNYLRYQQRGKKSFYRFSIIYRLGIGRHLGLGFESISAFGAGPKIEDNPLAHVFQGNRVKAITGR
jgi:hypothetical protein